MVHLFDSRVFRDSVLLCPAAKRRLSHFRHNCIYPRDSAVEKQSFYPPRTRVFSGESVDNQMKNQGFSRLVWWITMWMVWIDP